MGEQCQCVNPDCPAKHDGRCTNIATTIGIVNWCGPSQAYYMCQHCVGDD